MSTKLFSSQLQNALQKTEKNKKKVDKKCKTKSSDDDEDVRTVKQPLFRAIMGKVIHSLLGQKTSVEKCPREISSVNVSRWKFLHNKTQIKCIFGPLAVDFYNEDAAKIIENRSETALNQNPKKERREDEVQQIKLLLLLP